MASQQEQRGDRHVKRVAIAWRAAVEPGQPFTGEKLALLPVRHSSSCSALLPRKML